MDSGRQHTAQDLARTDPAGPAIARGDAATPRPDDLLTPEESAPHAAPGQPPLHQRVRSLPPRTVLVFGKSRSRTRQTSGFIEAFEAQGCRVRWVNLAKLRRRFGKTRAPRLAWRMFERFAPDLVFSMFPDIPQELLERIGRTTPTVHWCEQQLQPLEEWHIERLAATDFPLITNPTTVAALHQRGHLHAKAVREAFSRTWHYREPEREAVRDLAYIGGPGPDGGRARFLFELAHSHPITVYGKGYEGIPGRPSGFEQHKRIKPSGYRRVCAESRIVLGINGSNDDAGYWSNRTVLSLACGAFHLTHYVPGLEDMFENGRHLVWFHDLEDCRAKIDYYLSRPEERASIARQGHDLVHLRHRWHDRVADLFHLLRVRTERSAEQASRGI